MALRVGTVTPRYFASLTLSPASVAAATAASQNFTVAGLQTDMLVVVNKMFADANLFLTGSRVSAANTLTLDFYNASGGVITGSASQEFRVVAF